MRIKKYREKLVRILSSSPELKKIFLSDGTLKEKRNKIRRFLSQTLVTLFEDNPDIPSLEWVLMRDVVKVWRNTCSIRNEKLAGHSLVKYMNDILHSNDPESLEPPSPGFFAEIDHLVKGITGKTEVYKKSIPAFLKYTGRKAAKHRSLDLSKMANKAKKKIDSYPCGLSDDAVRKRSFNKTRIMKYFKATDLEWEKWQWHANNIIRDADTLRKLVDITDEEYEAVSLASKNKIAFGITPYYLSLMDNDAGGKNDAAIRAQVIPSLHYVKTLKSQKDDAESSMDFMLENDTSPIDGITRRYPNIVILKPVLTCPQICVYCQRNWEIEDVYSRSAVLSKEKLEKAIEWIENTPAINEVLITGGDPMLLSNRRLEHILSRLSKNPNIIRIRIGTRTPVTLPQRITDTVVRAINRFHIPGKREVVIITHFEHSYEITPQAMEAVQKFRRYGMEVYNQLVYTYFNSKKFEAAALRQHLRLIGVTPYYTFNTKGKEETRAYRVPISRLLQEQKEEARLMPGTVRTDAIVFNVPGLGKNYLDASQHHDIISILPDGRRVYEFHPWEKQLSLIDTYLYTDVSIYDYLKRLKADGEEMPDYKSIWYYY